jgi:hypothetical protein
MTYFAANNESIKPCHIISCPNALLAHRSVEK